MLFSEVVGQDAIKDHLIQEVKRGKLAHAQLLLGKQGYGGLPLALAFVQYLFCEQPTEKDACGTCAQCLKVQNLQHPDVHFTVPTVQSVAKTTNEVMPQWRDQLKKSPYFSLSDWTYVIDPKGRNPIIGTEESFEILKKLSLKSFEGGYKVMIIWCAEAMNSTSANKLLKILEEPPAKTLFLLVAESEEGLLKTILSRTQIVKVPRLDHAVLNDYLRTNFALNRENADSIANRAGGDLLEAIEIAQDDAGTENQEFSLFVELMRSCYKKDVLAMLDWADTIGNLPKERQKSFINYSLYMFRQSLMKNYTEETLLRVSEQEAGFLKNFARFITGNNIHQFMETFSQGHYYLERNAHAKLMFTNLCFNVMRYIHFA